MILAFMLNWIFWCRYKFNEMIPIVLLYYYNYYYYYKRVPLMKRIVSRNFKVTWQKSKNSERRFDATKFEMFFSVQWQGTSVWKALSSISAWILVVMETTRWKVENCSRRMLLQIKTCSHRSSSTLIMEWREHDVLADRSCRRESSSSTRIRTPLSRNRNQWRSQSNEVTWSHIHAKYHLRGVV